ncbi:hypothetical protein NA78x_002833 [Anatilimnocola sp. NA78]|uniref:hypothetical protein n=1 Tax=Anatilimnocola sp. NA78 TaxID=3415683 RepID=UPI003CE4D9C7
MTRVVCSLSAVILMAMVLIGRLSAATPIPPTPEEPPKFAVLKAADQQLLTFIYWKPVIEITSSGPPTLVNQLREFTIEQSKVDGRTVAGKSLENAKAWQEAVGSAMVLIPHDTTIDDVYTKSLNPETVLVQPKEAVAKETPAPYPDGTLPSNSPAGGNAASQPGAPLPEEVAAAQKAIAPEVTKLKLKVAPSPIVNPVINQALPGYMFFPVTSDRDDDDNGGNKGNRRPVRIIIKKPDGSTETVGRDDDDDNNKNTGDRIFDILREQMTVLTIADAKKYARVHLLLAGARHPKFTFGPINNIKVTQESNGGLMVYAEMPFTGGVSPNAPKSTAFTLTANFGKSGKVLGGSRDRR